MRLQKYMAECGVGSRRKNEEYIAGGMVRVNGHIAVLGESVDPQTDVVEFNGGVVRPEQARVLILFNKPRSVMCTASDPQGRETVFDYFRGFQHRLFHVGRLDYDSEGLLIMTNDGELANKLMHPRFELEKEYAAICRGEVGEEARRALERGVVLKDGLTAPAKVREVRRLSNGNTYLQITIREGRNRQVRRMLQAVGHDTLMLQRIRIGPLHLDASIKPGQWRAMTEEEVRALDEMLK